MPRNQRLADAIRSSGRSLEDLAADVGAHPKSLERWISSGRLPHLASRQHLATLLGVPMPVLWPESSGAAYGISELVGIYPTRNELSPSTVASLLDDATAHVDVLAYSAMWLWDTVPRFRERLAREDRGRRGRANLPRRSEKRCGAHSGRGGRIGGRHGESLQDRDRLREGRPGRQRWRPTSPRRRPASSASVERRCTASIFRFDDELLVNTHFWGNAASDSPLLHLRCGDDRGIAANALRSFDRVWDQARPLAG